MTFASLIRRAGAGALVTAALFFPVHPAAAQKAHAAAGDRDMQTLANYRLTEAGLRKFYTAMGELTKAAIKDPSLQDALDDNASSGDEDIAAMAAKSITSPRSRPPSPRPGSRAWTSRPSRSRTCRRAWRTR